MICTGGLPVPINGNPRQNHSRTVLHTAKKHRTFPVLFAGDPYGTRTHVTTVKGWCLNRLTNGPYLILFSRHHHVKGWFSDKARWPLSSVTLNATYRISLNSPLKSIINAFLNGQLGLTAWPTGHLFIKTELSFFGCFWWPVRDSNPCYHRERVVS